MRGGRRNAAIRHGLSESGRDVSLRQADGFEGRFAGRIYLQPDCTTVAKRPHHGECLVHLNTIESAGPRWRTKTTTRSPASRNSSPSICSVSKPSSQASTKPRNSDGPETFETSTQHERAARSGTRSGAENRRGRTLSPVRAAYEPCWESPVAGACHAQHERVRRSSRLPRQSS